MLLGVWSNFVKKRPRKLWFVLILNKIKCEQGRRLLVFLTKIEQYTREIFKVSILTQGTWTLVKLCRRNFCNAIKSEYSPNNFKNPKLKNVHFWKDFFDNISPIIGSSNHKGIVFLFFVFVSLDENQSSQYSFSRKEEVCFHFFLQFEIFFVKISLLFGAFLPCMYVCIFVESIFF